METNDADCRFFPVSIQYTLRCDMKRSLLAKDLTKTCEFIVHSAVSGRGPAGSLLPARGQPVTVAASDRAQHELPRGVTPCARRPLGGAWARMVLHRGGLCPVEGSQQGTHLCPGGTHLSPQAARQTAQMAQPGGAWQTQQEHTGAGGAGWVAPPTTS